MITIYELRDMDGSCRYIGQTRNKLEHRKRQQEKRFKMTFTIHALQEVDSEEAGGPAEQYWINLRRTEGCDLLNKNDGKVERGIAGQGQGRTFTEEHRINLSQALTGRTRSEAERKAISEGQKGRKHTEESKRKISEARAGKKMGPHSEERRRKIGESQRGKKRGPLSEEHKRKISESLKGRTKSEAP